MFLSFLNSICKRAHEDVGFSCCNRSQATLTCGTRNKLRLWGTAATLSGTRSSTKERIHARTYARTHTHTQSHARTSPRVDTPARMLTNMHARTNARTHKYTNERIRARTNEQMRIQSTYPRAHSHMQLERKNTLQRARRRVCLMSSFVYGRHWPCVWVLRRLSAQPSVWRMFVLMKGKIFIPVHKSPGIRAKQTSRPDREPLLTAADLLMRPVGR